MSSLLLCSGVSEPGPGTRLSAGSYRVKTVTKLHWPARTATGPTPPEKLAADLGPTPRMTDWPRIGPTLARFPLRGSRPTSRPPRPHTGHRPGLVETSCTHATTARFPVPFTAQIPRLAPRRAQSHARSATLRPRRVMRLSWPLRSVKAGRARILDACELPQEDQARAAPGSGPRDPARRYLEPRQDRSLDT